MGACPIPARASAHTLKPGVRHVSVTYSYACAYAARPSDGVPQEIGLMIESGARAVQGESLFFPLIFFFQGLTHACVFHADCVRLPLLHN